MVRVPTRSPQSRSGDGGACAARACPLSAIASEGTTAKECQKAPSRRPLENGLAAARSSVGCLRARWRSVWCQHQLGVLDDVADIFVVADEADPTVLPLQPHEVAGLYRLKTVVDCDYLAAFEPGGDKPHRAAARIDAEEHADVGGAGSRRVCRLNEPHVVGQHRAQCIPIALVEQRDITGHSG